MFGEHRQGPVAQIQHLQIEAAVSFGPVPLLGHVLDVARACRFDQLLCVIGGGASEVREAVDFSGTEVIENQAFGEGCSSSIAAALGAVRAECEILVLMLGDQPGVSPAVVGALLAGRGDAPLAVRLAQRMQEEGVYVVAFAYPVVPHGKARIRTQLSAAHSSAQLDRVLEAFERAGRELGIIR